MKRFANFNWLGLLLALGLSLPATGLQAQASFNPPNDPGNPNAPSSYSSQPANRDEFNKRRAQVMQRMEAIKQNVQQRLQGQREQICQQRQAKINQVFDKLTANAKRNLVVISTVQMRVENFYKDKKLNLANYDQLLQNANNKRQAAEGVFDAIGNVNFNCQEQDGRNVGQNVKEAVQNERQALREYRQAVKDLLVAVKQAAEQKTTNTSGVR